MTPIETAFAERALIARPGFLSARIEGVVGNEVTLSIGPTLDCDIEDRALLAHGHTMRVEGLLNLQRSIVGAARLVLDHHDELASIECEDGSEIIIEEPGHPNYVLADGCWYSSLIPDLLGAGIEMATGKIHDVHVLGIDPASGSTVLGRINGASAMAVLHANLVGQQPVAGSIGTLDLQAISSDMQPDRVGVYAAVVIGHFDAYEPH